MDEDVSIINTKTRNEKIKNFFINNKNKLIFGIIILLVGIVGIYSFDKYQINKKQRVSDTFNLVTIEYSENNKEKTITNLIEIINEKDPTYSPLSLYFLIDNELISDQKQINELFDILIDQTSLDDEIKNLVIYKKALFNADQSSEGDLLNLLNPLINSKSVWKSHALYLMAEYFYAKDQNQKAKEFFNQIIGLENPNPDIRLQADKRLNRDLSE
ncbi:tetratricopeptide repeat protein [Candidatus Pelagibacter sp.]|nr:tetratricopeptide repeat protein [Candidatus Pelagibacter sp.]